MELFGTIEQSAAGSFHWPHLSPSTLIVGADWADWGWAAGTLRWYETKIQLFHSLFFIVVPGTHFCAIQTLAIFTIYHWLPFCRAGFIHYFLAGDPLFSLAINDLTFLVPPPLSTEPSQSWNTFQSETVDDERKKNKCHC